MFSRNYSEWTTLTCTSKILSNISRITQALGYRACKILLGTAMVRLNLRDFLNPGVKEISRADAFTYPSGRSRTSDLLAGQHTASPRGQNRKDPLERWMDLSRDNSEEKTSNATILRDSERANE